MPKKLKNFEDYELYLKIGSFVQLRNYNCGPGDEKYHFRKWSYGKWSYGKIIKIDGTISRPLYYVKVFAGPLMKKEIRSFDPYFYDLRLLSDKEAFQIVLEQ